MIRWVIVWFLLLAVACVPLERRFHGINIGSKKFTENVILGEMMEQLAQNSGASVRHRSQMGGSSLLFQSLKSGTIDAYPDYTGTIRLELLANEQLENDEQVREHLAGMGILMSQPLGFNNGYALGMLESRAAELGLQKISDLTSHPELKFGLTNEFVKREDGWPNLKRHYGLSQDITGLDHDIAYRQLGLGAIDLMDVYTTDAKIDALGIRLLEDDRHYFPFYYSVMLIRMDLQERDEKAFESLLKLQNAIGQDEMISLNARAETENLSESLIAEEFLKDKFGLDSTISEPSDASRLWQYTFEHLQLVRKSLLPAILVGIPLGVLANRKRRLGVMVVGATGMIQTIPALALLVLLVPILNQIGIGSNTVTAIVALFLYSLLPIVRGTYSGLADIDHRYLESADALGMNKLTRLFRVELPLASRSIMSGVKTAAVLNIGFATLGALIGAGGYGFPVLTGIRRFDTYEILLGAIPAAVMAFACQLAFDWLDRFVIPKGLQLKSEVLN